METKISPYFDFIKENYLKLVYTLPIALMELFLGEYDKEDELIIRLFKSKLEYNTWCKSKYTQKLVAEGKKLIPDFEARYSEKKIIQSFKTINNALKLYGQFLSAGEMEELAFDLLNIVEEILDTDNNTLEQSKLSKENKENFKKLVDILNAPPSQLQSLSSLMMELPFLIFLAVANADDDIETKERQQFVEDLRDREWCQSRCSQFILLSTDYTYEELFKKYDRNSFQFDFRQVVRTLHMMEDVFYEEEVALIKEDMLTLANNIAKSAGGFVGLNKVSEEEREAIEKLRNLFESSQRKNRPTGKQSTAVAGKTKKKKSEFELLRAQPRVFIPGTKIVLTPERVGVQITLLDISKFSMQCKVDYREHYRNVSSNLNLSLTFTNEEQPLEIETIVCKAIRTDILEWDEEFSPLSLKVVWRFMKISGEDRQALRDLVDLYISRS